MKAGGVLFYEGLLFSEVINWPPVETHKVFFNENALLCFPFKETITAQKY